MPNIPIEVLVRAMAERLRGDEVQAQQLLAGALDALHLPTLPAYTPEQATQIGLVIAQASARMLSESADPTAWEAGPLLEQWIGLMAEQAAALATER